MLDPRIYRMGLVPVVLAVVVLAFSLGDQASPLTTNLAPDAYSGSNAYGTMTGLASGFPARPPGSAADQDIAQYVAHQLTGYGFAVSTDRFRGVTVGGPRMLMNVIGVRAGQQNGSIVVVAGRDGSVAGRDGTVAGRDGSGPRATAPRTPRPGCTGCAQLSGTAVLLELARVLSGETLQHTVVLASSTGSAGATGAIRLARALPQPVDAVIVLGDVAGTAVRDPVVLPWSDGLGVAPPLLRNTVGTAFAGQTGEPAGSTSLLAQLAHLVVPMAPGGEAPFNSSGTPAVLLSVSGEQAPGLNEPINAGQITGVGRATLQAINALDTGPTVPAPSAYLSFSGKTVPAWAVRLLALALILPVLLATVDGFARARRRGHSIFRWVIWVLAASAPFALCALIVRAAHAAGAIGGPVAVPLDGNMLRLDAGELALLAVLACLIVLGLVVVLRLVTGWIGPPGRAQAAGYGEGAATGVLIVLCVAGIAMWLTNPFAALLLVPALHLWLWVVVPDVRPPVPAVIVLIVGGLALPLLVGAEYAMTLGLGPLQAAWSWVLLIGGDGFSLVSAIEWSLFLGSVAGVIVIAVRTARQPRPETAPVTIRGPVTYAGPGSLGGTKSALRR